MKKIRLKPVNCVEDALCTALEWSSFKDHLWWVDVRLKPWHRLPGNLPQIWQKFSEYEVLPKKHLSVGSPCLSVPFNCLPDPPAAVWEPPLVPHCMGKTLRTGIKITLLTFLVQWMGVVSGLPKVLIKWCIDTTQRIWEKPLRGSPPSMALWLRACSSGSVREIIPPNFVAGRQKKGQGEAQSNKLPLCP